MSYPQRRLVTEPREHESAAPDVASLGGRDGEYKGGGNCNIDGIATVSEHMCAGIRTVTIGHRHRGSADEKPSASQAPARHQVFGGTFAFNRNRFIGSYLAFSAASRGKFGP